MFSWVLRHKNIYILALHCVVTALIVGPSAGQPAYNTHERAVFFGLDKSTAETTQFTVNMNETVQFGALLITPKTCYTRPATETQQNSVLIEINEITLKRTVKSLYRGWLIAEAPNLSEVEHPIYDVWLKGCD